MASSTRKEKVLSSISPAALVAIVAMNLFLIYLMFETLDTQTQILQQIKNNTEISLTNQEIGLNISHTNQELIGLVLKVEKQSNDTFTEILNIASSNSNQSDLP